MQHYRVPTRFLDWTDAALVALYFALTAWRTDSTRGRSQPRPAVWAFKSYDFKQTDELDWNDQYIPQRCAGLSS
jgi:FRG domain